VGEKKKKSRKKAQRKIKRPARVCERSRGSGELTPGKGWNATDPRKQRKRLTESLGIGCEPGNGPKRKKEGTDGHQVKEKRKKVIHRTPVEEERGK